MERYCKDDSTCRRKLILQVRIFTLLLAVRVLTRMSLLQYMNDCIACSCSNSHHACDVCNAGQTQRPAPVVAVARAHASILGSLETTPHPPVPTNTSSSAPTEPPRDQLISAPVASPPMASPSLQAPIPEPGTTPGASTTKPKEQFCSKCKSNTHNAGSCPERSADSPPSFLSSFRNEMHTWEKRRTQREKDLIKLKAVNAGKSLLARMMYQINVCSTDGRLNFPLGTLVMGFRRLDEY